MTLTTTEYAVPDELAASVQHLELITNAILSAEARATRLKAVRAQTLEQIAVAAKRLTHEWSPRDLLTLYEKLKCSGLHTAWTTAGLPHPQRLKNEVDAIKRHQPNDPVSGGWIGDWVVAQANWGPYGRIENGTHPMKGTPVVYVLYGANSEPVYCGSTQDLYARLKAHHRDSKEFVAWRAVPCNDREQAYQLEDRLLRQSCPPLNRKASR